MRRTQRKCLRSCFRGHYSAAALQADAGARTAPNPRDAEKGLRLINSIPDKFLLAGEKATNQWIKTHMTTAERASIGGCTAAIAGVIASTAIPAAKLLKIKKLIAGLGGVSEAVKIMWGASFSYEKLQALGGAAGALAAELIGITAIKNQCFS